MEVCFAGEVMLASMKSEGFEITEDHEQSDAVIVNTCSFVADAKSESLEAILDAASLCKDRPQKQLIVTGCMAQRYADDLAIELPEVDAFIGFEGYGEAPKYIQELFNAPRAEGEAPRVLVGSASVPFRSETERVRLTPPHSAYIRVAEGCDHGCSFCAIPGFRCALHPVAHPHCHAMSVTRNHVEAIEMKRLDVNFACQISWDRKSSHDVMNCAMS